MPGNPRTLVEEAERQFPVRLAVKTGGGIGTRYQPMTDWLDEHCGLNGWRITSTGRRTPLGEDAVAIYVNSPMCAAPLSLVGACLVRHLAFTSYAPMNRSGVRLSKRTALLADASCPSRDWPIVQTAGLSAVGQ